jgi:predicted nucleic acid-binding protein
MPVRSNLEKIKQILDETQNVVLDTNVLLCYFMDEIQDINSILEEYIFKLDSSIMLYGHNLIKTELFYITCRLKGMSEAENLVKKLENILISISDIWLYKKAASIKCKYPIAISDCFSISLAILQDCPVFFLPEKELSGEIIEKIKKDYNTKIYQIMI